MENEHTKECNWNYTPHSEKLGLQNDWNQTLVSLINKMNAQRYRNKHVNSIPSETIISCPEKFKILIESLVYYNNETKRISDRYDVKFHSDNSIDFLLLAEDYKIHIENFAINN